MAEEPLFPNPIGRIRKAASKVLDAITEPKAEQAEQETDLRRRGLLAGTAASVIIGPGEAAKQMAKTLLPNAATVAQTIAAGGTLGKVVEKVATNWQEISGTLDKTGKLITSMAGKYGYNPILEDFPRHITDNIGPQNVLRELSKIDLSRIPSELSIEDFAPDNVGKIAEALGGEVSKDSFEGKLKNISRVLEDLQKRGKSAGKNIQTVGDAQKLLGERTREVTRDVIANCDPKILREGTITDLEESLRDIHGVDTGQLPEIQRAREGVWERNRREVAEWEKKWDKDAREKVEKANESPRQRPPEDQIVKCRVVSDYSEKLGEKVFTIAPASHSLPTGFRGLTQIHFLHFLRIAAKSQPELNKMLADNVSKTTFPSGTIVTPSAEGGLRIVTTNKVLQDFLATSTIQRNPDGRIDKSSAPKTIEVPFLTQIVPEIKG